MQTTTASVNLTPDAVGPQYRMEKEITVAQFAEELMTRIDRSQTIDCCKDEIRRLAHLAAQKMGAEKILVHWKD